MVKSSEYRGVSKARGRHVGVVKSGDKKQKSKSNEEKQGQRNEGGRKGKY